MCVEVRPIGCVGEAKGQCVGGLDGRFAGET